MPPLVRVEQNPSSDERYRLLGYDWLEILWTEASAVGVPDETYGSWCDRTIVVLYVCMTESGLTRIASDDFWTALEEYEEYIASESKPAEASPLQIVASAGSVVHVGSSAGSSFAAVTAAGPANVVQSSQWDFTELADEIRVLRQQTVASPASREALIRAGALAEAEEAAENRDPKAAAGALRRAGKWAAESANKLGLGVLEAFIKHEAGL